MIRCIRKSVSIDIQLLLNLKIGFSNLGLRFVEGSKTDYFSKCMFDIKHTTKSVPRTLLLKYARKAHAAYKEDLNT